MAEDNPTEAYPELAPEAEADNSPNDDKPLAVNSADWTVEVLCSPGMHIKINLQPEYQREYVWRLKPELPSRLVESLLLNIPVPPIYFAKLPDESLEVIDGQQRLTTLFRFVEDKFAFQKLERMKSLNGFKFSQLPKKQQNKILGSQIRSVVIETGANDQMRYEVFERLNRGAMALNEQEIRNCVYRGGFCDLLARLEKDQAWRKVKGGAEPEPRFAEREMILRFFAFAERINYYKGNLKRFLNEYMADYAPQDQGRLDEQAEMFRQAMRNIYSVFGNQSARLYSAGTEDNPTVDGRWETKFSVSALDIQASALLGQNPAKVQVAAEQIRESYLLYILSNSQVRLAISRQPAAATATKTRCFGFKAMVQDILSNTNVEPRFFAYSFRQQLFNEDPTCKLCNNQIHNFEDSAVDHILPYSKGGKTQPDNAQIAHRSCNATKCANIDTGPSNASRSKSP